MGNLTIEDIRKLAELNLTSEYYKTYLQIIEPNDKSLIPNYLRDYPSSSVPQSGERYQTKSWTPQ